MDSKAPPVDSPQTSPPAARIEMGPPAPRLGWRAALRRFIAAPVVPGDEGLTSRAWLTNVTLLACFGTALVPIPGDSLPRQLIAGVSPAVALVVLKILLNRGYVDLVARALTMVMLIFVTLLGLTAGGLSSPYTAGYVLVVFGAGLMVGTRYSLVVAAAGLLAGLALAGLEANGMLLELGTRRDPVRDWTVLAVALSVAVALLSAARSTIQSSLHRVTRELAERTEAELALSSRDAELRLALDAARMGTWSWFAETGVLSWSPEVHRITNGLTASVEGGLPLFLDHVHPDDQQVFDRGIAQALVSARDPQRFEARLMLPGGAVRWFELRGQAFADEAGPAGVTGTIADVDDRRRVEDDRETLVKELGTRNSELERFTYTVSHDLKSPLITIRGFLGFLEEDALAGRVERIRDDTARIVEATVKMQRLLDELLDLSRAGRTGESPETFSGKEAVEEALSLVQGRLNESGVRVELQPGIPTLYGDRPRIVQVLQNLIDNAGSFLGSEPDPRIVIGTRADSVWPLIVVRDNGIGIAPEYHERVFGLFEKLDPRSLGTGVGLALVKRIVEHHGGEVWVESEGQGTGATFCFTLPPPPLRSIDGN